MAIKIKKQIRVSHWKYTRCLIDVFQFGLESYHFRDGQFGLRFHFNNPETPVQDEVKRLIQAANDADLVRQLEERSKENRRTMLFFRWYGGNINASLNVPAFHQPWKYIETIGVSVFNRKVSTSKHFGHLRASLRVLYNLNDMKDDSAYIVVGGTTNYWRDNKLFIFDDTLLHLSANETEQSRYCLFVDIIRPTPFPRVMVGVVTIVRYLTQSFKFVYYSNWKVIE